MSRDTTDIANELLAENAAIKGQLAAEEAHAKEGWRVANEVGTECDQLKAQVAELAKQEPAGTVTANSDNDSIAIIDSVIPVGTELFLRPAPPAPVKLPSLKQTISGERYVWSDGVYNYQQDVIEILKAAGVVVEVADE